MALGIEPASVAAHVLSASNDGSRRAMLAKAGKFAYAAPALALLTEPRNAIGAYAPKVRPKVKRKG